MGRTAFAGLAGTLAAPYVSVSPGMGIATLIDVLLVVVIGGVGSVGGAMTARRCTCSSCSQWRSRGPVPATSADATTD